MSNSAQLCKCNHCDSIMYDENPSNQPMVEVPEGTTTMIQVEDDGEVFWACRNCMTDAFLQNITE